MADTVDWGAYAALRQAYDGHNMTPLEQWWAQSPEHPLAGAYAQIDALRQENDQHRAWLDSPVGQNDIHERAWEEMALVAEQSLPQEMHAAHPEWYGMRDDGLIEGFDPGDPDYLGQQAEQRFYAEQDPNSQWYRDDLYHGEPGPDVALDLAEAVWRAMAQAGPSVAEPAMLADGGSGYRSREDDEIQEHILRTEGATEPPRDTSRSLLEQIEHLRERLQALSHTQEPTRHRDQGMGW
jgi:hypothetical protein